MLLKVRQPDQKIMLKNAYQRIKRLYRRAPLWTFVAGITGFGSTSAKGLCRFYGWDPDAEGLEWLE